MENSLSLRYRMGLMALTLLGWLAIYFLVNRRTVDPQRRRDFRTKLDNSLPFLPQFALIYFSTYLFVLEPFFILSDARQFYWMLASFISISMGASLIHAIFPSKIERVEDFSTRHVSGKLLNRFQQTCKPYGNFPSMHVGLSVPVVIANYLTYTPLTGGIMLLWGIFIALSTLFTKQHYLWDVLAGLVIGLLISFLYSGIL